MIGNWKPDVYLANPGTQAVLDRMRTRLDAHVEELVDGFTDASIDGLLEAAVESPAGFRLLLQYTLREPEFSERTEKFHADIIAAAYLQISAILPGEALAQCAQLAPVMPSTCPSTTRRSTARSARCRCARSPIGPRRLAR